MSERSISLSNTEEAKLLRRLDSVDASRNDRLAYFTVGDGEAGKPGLWQLRQMPLV
jgi:hypothetical protein